MAAEEKQTVIYFSVLLSESRTVWKHFTAASVSAVGDFYSSSLCVVVHPTRYWKIVWAPESEIRADRSHTPCFPRRLLSCFLLCLHLLQALYCKIMQYICKNIHSPTRLKTLPCQWAAIACSLQMDSASKIPHLSISFFLSLFFSLSEAFTCAAQVMLNMRALPQALNSLSGNGLFCFTVKTTQRFLGKRKGKKIVSLIVSGENIIWKRKPCYWMHYHIHKRTGGGKAVLIKAMQEAYS